LNQLDRYTLPIVTTSAGYDLHYGDKLCMRNKTLPDELGRAMEEYSLTDYFKNCTDSRVKYVSVAQGVHMFQKCNVCYFIAVQ